MYLDNTIIKHLRQDGKLIATLAIKEQAALPEVVAYGISVVSKKDTPNIKKGRDIAVGRLKKALNVEGKKTKRAMGNEENNVLLNLIRYENIVVDYYTPHGGIHTLNKLLKFFGKREL